MRVNHEIIKSLLKSKISEEFYSEKVNTGSFLDSLFRIIINGELATKNNHLNTEIADLDVTLNQTTVFETTGEIVWKSQTTEEITFSSEQQTTMGFVQVMHNIYDFKTPEQNAHCCDTDNKMKDGTIDEDSNPLSADILIYDTDILNPENTSDRNNVPVKASIDDNNNETIEVSSPVDFVPEIAICFAPEPMPAYFEPYIFDENGNPVITDIFMDDASALAPENNLDNSNTATEASIDNNDENLVAVDTSLNYVPEIAICFLPEPVSAILPDIAMPVFIDENGTVVTLDNLDWQLPADMYFTQDTVLTDFNDRLLPNALLTLTENNGELSESVEIIGAINTLEIS